MTRFSRTHIVVGRIFHMTAGVTADRFLHPLDRAESCLDAPEAACSKNCFFNCHFQIPRHVQVIYLENTMDPGHPALDPNSPRLASVVYTSLSRLKKEGNGWQRAFEAACVRL